MLWLPNKLGCPAAGLPKSVEVPLCANREPGAGWLAPEPNRFPVGAAAPPKRGPVEGLSVELAPEENKPPEGAAPPVAGVPKRLDLAPKRLVPWSPDAGCVKLNVGLGASDRGAPNSPVCLEGSAGFVSSAFLVVSSAGRGVLKSECALVGALKSGFSPVAAAGSTGLAWSETFWPAKVIATGVEKKSAGLAAAYSASGDLEAVWVRLPASLKVPFPGCSVILSPGAWRLTFRILRPLSSSAVALAEACSWLGF